MTSSTDDHFTLQWNDYQSHLVSAFTDLRDDRDFVDLTLSCEGRKIASHKMLLSACSPYFRSLLKDNPCPHPVIILRQTSYEDLAAVIHFIYNGQVSLHQSRVKSFIRTAKSLKIRGLCEAADLGYADETERRTPGAPARKRPKTEEEEPVIETQAFEESWSYDYDNSNNEGIPSVKKTKRYTQKFRDKWLSDPEFDPWLMRHESDPEKAVCSACQRTMNAKLYDIRFHARTIKHRKNCGLIDDNAAATTTTVIRAERGLDGREIIIKETKVMDQEEGVHAIVVDDPDNGKEVLLRHDEGSGELTAVMEHHT